MIDNNNIELKDVYITIRDRTKSLSCQRHNAEAMITVMGDTGNSDEHTFVDIFVTVEQLVEFRETIDAFIYDQLAKGDRCQKK